uniref:ADP-ribose pyrophosphatase, mitochondrial n=1 Tax=Pavo cristatus TaxID=9049 RepID=A0A8C9EUB6_PAVCR
MSDSRNVKNFYHNKALTSPYPRSHVERAHVPADKVDWLTEWKDYQPVEYTAVSILSGPQWADPQAPPLCFSPTKKHKIMFLFVTFCRWKRDRSGNKIAHPVTGKNILQFVAIKRRDCGEWAIPGGMVDPGEKISATLKREFGEEALNSLQKSPEEKAELEKQLQRLFSQEHFVVYRGYVDDPRNTDNAWMETEAVNYHDETGETMDNLPLEAGDDAGMVKWVDISEKLKLYANHSYFIKLVTEKRGAHWSEEAGPECPE